MSQHKESETSFATEDSFEVVSRHATPNGDVSPSANSQRSLAEHHDAAHRHSGEWSDVANNTPQDFTMVVFDPKELDGSHSRSPSATNVSTPAGKSPHWVVLAPAWNPKKSLSWFVNLFPPQPTADVLWQAGIPLTAPSVGALTAILKGTASSLAAQVIAASASRRMMVSQQQHWQAPNYRGELQRQARSLRPRHGAAPSVQHTHKFHHAQQHYHYHHHTQVRHTQNRRSALKNLHK
jgi:hypothetical protein